MFKALIKFFTPATLIDVEWLEKYDDAIISFSDGTRYRGNCTVWHDYHTGKRQNTTFEKQLCDIWTVARWKRDDKNKA